MNDCPLKNFSSSTRWTSSLIWKLSGSVHFLYKGSGHGSHEHGEGRVRGSAWGQAPDWECRVITAMAEPPPDRQLLFFTGKCFSKTNKKYSRRYQVPVETERFVWLARDHTLYPGSWSKWKLPLNKITSGDVQQAKQWTRKLSLPLATKLSLITVCKGWVVSTRSIVFPTSVLKNVNVITRKLDLDQMSVAPTHAEKHW